jgi:hypothetical protein
VCPAWLAVSRGRELDAPPWKAVRQSVVRLDALSGGRVAPGRAAEVGAGWSSNSFQVGGSLAGCPPEIAAVVQATAELVEEVENDTATERFP